MAVTATEVGAEGHGLAAVTEFATVSPSAVALGRIVAAWFPPGVVALRLPEWTNRELRALCHVEGGPKAGVKRRSHGVERHVGRAPGRTVHPIAHLLEGTAPPRLFELPSVRD